jgi:hypothetical protein
MFSRLPRATRLLMALLCGAGFAKPAFAAWASDGNAVVTWSYTQNQATPVPDAEGGVIFAWLDAGSGWNTDVLAVRWSNTAATCPGWTPGGDRVTNIACDKLNPAAASDGAGGALLAWEDNRCVGYYQIYARRVAPGGLVAAGWPQNGVRIAATVLNQRRPAVADDGNGGAFVAWTDLREPYGDIYLQHLDGSGNLAAGWPASGVGIGTGSAAQSSPVIAADGAGGVFVAWVDRRSGNDDIYLQHVTGAGALAPGFVANGLAVAAAPGDQRAPSMAADGAGGVVLAWEDHRSLDLDIYGIRVQGDGSRPPGFAANGNAVCAAAGDQSAPRVASDVAGSLLAAWQDHRGTSLDVYVSRLTAAGALAPGWTAQGTAVATAIDDQSAPALASDGANGAYVVWQDRRAGDFDIYAARLAADGVLAAGWTAGGTPLCRAMGDQSAPQVCPAAGGGAFAIWTDARNAATSGLDLYAQYMLGNGPVPVRPSNLSALHHDGQTFLTWDPPPGTGWTHRVYFSTTAIATDADLATSALLASVGDSAAIDRRLSTLMGSTYTFSPDSALAPLAPTKGLFVVTVPSNRDGWYAVTSQLQGGPEDRHVVPGGNVLASPLHETLALPRPVFQRVLTLSGHAVDQYTLWTWSQDTPLFPAMSNRPGWPYDCGVTRGGPKGPVFVRGHARGGSFTQVVTITNDPRDWVLSLDEYTLNEDAQMWWYGYHPGYDLGLLPTPVPTGGTVIDYTNRRVLHTIRWARANFDVDTSRVYAFGYSLGGTLALRLALAHPELITAAMGCVAKLDFSFVDEPVATAGFNPAGVYRPMLDRMWGTLATNLPSSEGPPVYVMTDDDSLAARSEERGAAFTVSFSGRHDDVVGWKERLGYFESMRSHRQGHMEFWDNRDHYGTLYPGAMMTNLDPKYLYRFRSTLSWPAFSNCSLDNVVGDGTDTSGDSLGTINGYLDWDPAVIDSTSGWAVTLETRGLNTMWGALAAPESLTVDVTPRRLQRFHLARGAPVAWEARRVSDDAALEDGIVNVDALGLITIPGVRVYRTGTRLALGAFTNPVGVTPIAPAAGALTLDAIANPAGARVRLRVHWPVDGRARVDVFDMLGRRVLTVLDAPVTAGAWIADADLSARAPGVYLVRAAELGHEVTRRLVRLR